MSDQPRVSVIDIGSNSIKLLVAQRDPLGLSAACLRTIDTRISTGIGSGPLRLGTEAMEQAVVAVQQLLASSAEFEPAQTVIVATSAVREALNRDEFRHRIRSATGHELRILSGGEEAALIGAGLRCDPAIQGWQDFHLFDLGGGSLECLAFRGSIVETALSLPLGCVRLMERFSSTPGEVFTRSHGEAVASHVRQTLAAGWRFPLGQGVPTVGTGGTLTCTRAILAARSNETLERTSELVPVSTLRLLLEELGSMPLAARREIPGLPPRRADVFPTALATFIAVAEAGGIDAFHHSFYNLRWGLAAEVL